MSTEEYARWDNYFKKYVGGIPRAEALFNPDLMAPASSCPLQPSPGNVLWCCSWILWGVVYTCFRISDTGFGTEQGVLGELPLSPLC